jgi:DNA-directed RNA polymerase II subunit RPB1
MYRLNLTMLDIYLRIKAGYPDVDCMFSDDNAGNLVFRIRLQRDAKSGSVVSEDIIAELKAFEHNLVHNLLLKGMKGIKKVSMHNKTLQRFLHEKDQFVRVSEWVLDTDGTNLQEMMANPNVDPYRTRSNDVWEIYDVLGVEAARNALYREIMDVGDGLNYRHVSLLLDTMSNRGTLMSVDRHGINRGDVGPLAKSSFEETTDILIKASAFSEYDHINGVSANIMLGQLPPCGTGDSEILFDEDKFRMLYSAKAPVSQASQIREVLEEDEAPAPDPCGYTAIAFQYNIPQTNGVSRQLPSAQVQFT